MKNLKLNTIASNNLSEVEMNYLKGGKEGDSCCCGCMYEGQPGGSTTAANDAANEAGGLHSKNCLPEVIVPYP